MDELQPQAQSNTLLTNGIGSAAQSPPWRVTPEFDLYESDDAYLARFDVPGASAQGLSIQVLGRILEIRAERTPAAHGADVALLRYERILELPADVDADSATALLRNGILEIRITKSAALRRVRIPIRTN
jgi:HSP20 family protein